VSPCPTATQSTRTVVCFPPIGCPAASQGASVARKRSPAGSTRTIMCRARRGVPARRIVRHHFAPCHSRSGRASSAGTVRAQSAVPARSAIASTLPPPSMVFAATAASSGPHPATRVERPGSMPCDFSRIVAAARPITPGVVHPSNGTTRSVVPDATINARAEQCTGPCGPVASTRYSPVTAHTGWAKKVVTVLAASSRRSASPAC
jgi:hypothetical protein